jgi:hypothetical protein
MKRAMKGDFDLFCEASKLYSSLGTITDGKKAGESYYDEKRRYVKNFKKAALIAVQVASSKYERKLVNEQEVLNNISEIIMNTYVTESAVLRVKKLEETKGAGYAAVYRDIIDVLVYDAADSIRKSANDAVNSMAPDNSADLLRAMHELTRVAGVNVRDARRRIADRLIEDNRYKF